jgi:hypothetical protein
MPIEVAHVRSAATAGVGMKSSDAFILSLCRDHHAEQHRIGQKSFEMKHGFRMIEKAKLFFEMSPHRHKLDDPYGQ